MEIGNKLEARRQKPEPFRPRRVRHPREFLSPFEWNPVPRGKIGHPPFSEAFRLGDRGASQGLCETLFALGKFEEALFHCEKALELEPNNPSLWLRKGRALRELKRPAEAIPCFDRLIELEPNNHLGWYNKGVSLLDLKRYREALDCNERAIEIDPNFAWAWCNKGAALANIGKYRKALPCFEKAVSMGDTDSKAGVALCLSHMMYIFRFFHWLEKLGSPH